MAQKNKSIFDILNDLSHDSNRLAAIANDIREKRPELAGYLDEAYQHIGGAYIAIETYLEELK